jgi:hypothetical protein
MTNTPVCRYCSVELVAKDNWAPYFAKTNNKTCRTCYNKIHNAKNNKENNPKALYIDGKYISRKDPRYKILKPGHYKNIGDALFQSSEASNIKEGYVYIITNKAWPDWVKIGMAIDAEDRCNGYQTSSPFRDYVLEHYVPSNNRRKAEKEAHKKAKKLASDVSNEWFKLDVETAKQILDNLNEHGRRATEETNTVTQEDKLQELPAQGDLWSYSENRKAS